METGNNSSNCGRFDTSTFRGLVHVQATLSDFSFFCILLVLVFTWCLRSHQHLLSQRRVLILVLCTLASSFVTGMNVVGYFVYRSPHLEGYCTAVGFLHQLTIWWTLLAACCIMFDVSLKLGGINQTRQAKRLELMYIAVTFVAPLLLHCWIPFLLGGYGTAGPICWIRYTNETDGCQKISSGLHLIIALYFAPVGLILAFMAAWLLVLLPVLHVKVKRSELSFDSEANEMNVTMKNEIRPVLIYPAIFIVTSAPNFVLTSIAVTHENLGTPLIVLWSLTASLLQLQGMFYSLALVFQRDVNTGTNIFIDIRNRRRGYQRISDYPIIPQLRSDSIKEDDLEVDPLNVADSHNNPT